MTGHPLRAALRLIANKDGRLWKRKNKNNVQSMYNPEDLYISHIIIYATEPQFVQDSHITNVMCNCNHFWKLQFDKEYQTLPTRSLLGYAASCP